MDPIVLALSEHLKVPDEIGQRVAVRVLYMHSAWDGPVHPFRPASIILEHVSMQKSDVLAVMAGVVLGYDVAMVDVPDEECSTIHHLVGVLACLRAHVLSGGQSVTVEHGRVFPEVCFIRMISIPRSFQIVFLN